MMVCENDKFQIPEEYLKMSASERKRLEEEELKKRDKQNDKKEKLSKLKGLPVVFNI